jgi:hypothetical protein
MYVCQEDCDAACHRIMWGVISEFQVWMPQITYIVPDKTVVFYIYIITEYLLRENVVQHLSFNADLLERRLTYPSDFPKDSCGRARFPKKN